MKKIICILFVIIISCSIAFADVVQIPLTEEFDMSKISHGSRGLELRPITESDNTDIRILTIIPMIITIIVVLSLISFIAFFIRCYKNKTDEKIKRFYRAKTVLLIILGAAIIILSFNKGFFRKIYNRLVLNDAYNAIGNLASATVVIGQFINTIFLIICLFNLIRYQNNKTEDNLMKYERIKNKLLIVLAIEVLFMIFVSFMFVTLMINYTR